MKDGKVLSDLPTEEDLLAHGGPTPIALAEAGRIA
jgi:hypothetical protein